MKTRNLAWLLAFATGCTASSADVAPPRSDPYFPSALALSPDERYLFVLNGNSDLRYDAGTIQVLDLDEVEALVAAREAGGEPPAGCEADVLDPRRLTCLSTPDGGAAPFVVASATARIGNFGSAIAVQPLVTTDGSPSPVLRVFATVRGDPSLTWGDFDPRTGRIACGSQDDYPRCAESHRLDSFPLAPQLPGLADEPFGLAVDGAAGHAFVTSLTTGQVTLASLPDVEGSEPYLVDAIGGIFQPSRSTGRVRAVGVAARDPGNPEGFVYVTSSTEARVALLYVARDALGLGEVLAVGPSFDFDGEVSDRLPGDTRGIAFSANADRAYIVSRFPPALRVYDTSMTATGVPRNELLGSVEICAQGAAVAVAERDGARRAYVPCFGTGQLWVVDLERRVLAAVSDVGRGPDAVAVAAGRNRVYVANYAEDTIAVVDVEPGSPMENRAVLRLGKPRVSSEQ